MESLTLCPPALSRFCHPSAFKALYNSHLYGRHLVLEWAKDDDSLDTLREKAARQAKQQGGAATSKRRRLDDAALQQAREAARAEAEEDDDDD